jgi:hypothetical protein
MAPRWLGGGFNDWLNARAARRLVRSGKFPATIERAYWNAAQYERDSARLDTIGYEVDSEADSDPYLSSTIPASAGGAMGHLDRQVERRVPSFHVTYRRVKGTR